MISKFVVFIAST